MRANKNFAHRPHHDCRTLQNGQLKTACGRYLRIADHCETQDMPIRNGHGELYTIPVQVTKEQPFCPQCRYKLLQEGVRRPLHANLSEKIHLNKMNSHWKRANRKTVKYWDLGVSDETVVITKDVRTGQTVKVEWIPK